jgi:hypothetical protein
MPAVAEPKPDDRWVTGRKHRRGSALSSHRSREWSATTIRLEAFTMEPRHRSLYGGQCRRPEVHSGSAPVWRPDAGGGVRGSSLPWRSRTRGTGNSATDKENRHEDLDGHRPHRCDRRLLRGGCRPRRRPGGRRGNGAESLPTAGLTAALGIPVPVFASPFSAPGTELYRQSWRHHVGQRPPEWLGRAEPRLQHRDRLIFRTGPQK